MSIVIETTLGDITVDLYLNQRPVTCLNFLKLCKMKYYNFNLFHSIRSGFIAQTGDPTAEGSGGQSIFGLLEGPDKRFFMGEKLPKIRHTNTGTLSMVCTGDMMVGSQFFFTLAPDLDSLDGVHCVIGEVTEGHDVLRKLNDVICDESHRPYRDVRITHTVVLEDPFNDPTGLRLPSRSPSPSAERLKGGRIGPDEDIDEAQGKSAQEVQELIEEKEAKARATILEIVGDLPDADIAPPENVLFVCKLNPVTTDEDLEIIFSRFGKIVGCEVIRDKKTGDSLQYAFIEFSEKKSCEDAYFKMDNVLIDDRRIHVDFSQSVSRMRWLGKGRGVKYLNDGESKDKTLNNHTSKHNDNHEGGDHKNGKIDENKRRHDSKDRDHHKSDKDKTDRDSRHKKSDRDRSRKSRSKSRSRKSRSKSRSRKSRSKSRSRTKKSRHRSKRHRSRSKSKDRSRKRRSRSKSRDKSKRARSRSRDRSRRERRRSRSRRRSNRDRSRSRQRSRRDRSRSRRGKSRVKSKSTRHRSRSSTRKVKSRHGTTERYKERSSNRKDSDKPKDRSSTRHRDRSTSTESQTKIEQSQDSRKSKSQSVSPVNDRERSESKPKEEPVVVLPIKKSRWIEVNLNINNENEKKSAVIQSEHHNDVAVLPSLGKPETVLPALNKPESTEDNTSNCTDDIVNNHIQKEDTKKASEKNYLDQSETEVKKQPQMIEQKTSSQKKESNKSTEKDTRTPTPVIKKKDIKNKISTKNDKKKKEVKTKSSQKKRKPSTSDSSTESSSSESSSSSDDIKKKRSLKRKKKKVSTSSSDSSSSQSSSSSSSTDSSNSSSSSDSEPIKKKRKKNANSKANKTKKTKKKA